MDAFEAEGQGYICPICNGQFEEDSFDSGRCWQVCCEVDSGIHDLFQHANQIDYWRCENGCVIRNESAPTDIRNWWECGACGNQFLVPEEAAQCCQ